jgi:hypothetical protein
MKYLALVVVLLAGCVNVPRTAPAWTQATDSAGEPLVDAATGKPVLAPLLDEEGNRVHTPVLNEDGTVVTDKKIDMDVAEGLVTTAATVYPPFAPFSGMALGLLGLFGARKETTA